MSRTAPGSELPSDSRRCPPVVLGRMEDLAAMVAGAERITMKRHSPEGTLRALTSLNRLCPVCGGRQGEILHSQRLEVVDDYPLPSCFDVVLCSACGMVYSDTAATQGDYDRFYAGCSVHQNPA